MVFHLTARTLRREALFVPDLRDGIASLTRRMVGRTDAQLLAYAVMPNHLHVILRQGRHGLGEVMQPLLRRIALRVHRRHRIEGAVFERRYRDRMCGSADHVREALVYTHLNAWRAGLCDDDMAYPWMTHRAYLPGTDPACCGIDQHAQLPVLELFASSRDCSRNDLCHDYLRWFEWRQDQDRVRSLSADEVFLRLSSPRPLQPADAEAWRRHFAPAFRDHLGARPRQLPDLRDFVDAHVSRLVPGHTVHDLRGPWLPRPLARARARLIRLVTRRGYGTAQVARYFSISPTTVSRAKHAVENDADG